MTKDQIKVWRLRHGMSQREAAEALGICLSTYSNYETGWQRGVHCTKRAPIPKPVELACAALELGITDYLGQPITLAVAGVAAES